MPAADQNPVLTVEVVYAAENRQKLVELTVKPGTTVAQAIELSRIHELFREGIPADCPVGIWGRVVDSTQQLRDGDRVEIYRQLKMDPREARRILATAGRTMNQGNTDEPAD